MALQIDGGNDLMNDQFDIVKKDNTSPVKEDRFVISTVNDDNNDEKELDIRDISRTLLRHKLLIITVTLLVFLFSLVNTLMIKPTYKAATTIQINSDDPKVLEFDVEAGKARSSDTKDFYQTQYELLKSRALARLTIDSLSLEPQLSSPQTIVKKPFFAETLEKVKKLLSIKTKENESTIIKLGKPPIEDSLLANLTVTPVKNSRLVELSYIHTEPQMAATIVNSFAENFIRMNLNRRKDSTSFAEDFLQNEIANAKSKLEESEAKLVNFAKKENIIKTDGESGQNTTSQNMQVFNNALSTAVQERISAESKYKQAKALSGSQVLQDEGIQELKKNLFKLQSDYQEKLQIYKPGYPLMLQLENQINEIQTQINTTTKQTSQSIENALYADFLAAKQKEQDLQQKLSSQKDQLFDLQDKSIGYNTLQREVETNRNMYESLLQRIKEVNIAGSITNNNIAVVDPAITPFQQYSPNLKQNLLKGSLLGFIIGIALAFLLEFIDDRIKSQSDLEKILGLPILGTIPTLKSKKTTVFDYAFAALHEPKSALAESFRSLRTNLMFATREGLPRSLNITSSLPFEAKSSTCINLATVLAQANKRVLLVDADLRKPTLHQRFKLDNSIGLSNYLTHQADIHDATQSTIIPNVSVITAGPLTPNPVEVLSSDRLMEILNLVPVSFDIIILDSPPTIGLSDALLISNRVNATIMVAAFSQSKKRAILDGMKRLRHAQANVIGTIFTKVRGNDSSGYGYDYQYYYSYGNDTNETTHRHSSKNNKRLL